MSGRESQDKNVEELDINEVIDIIVDSRVKKQQKKVERESSKISIVIAILTILFQSYIIMVSFNILIELDFIQWKSMNYLHALCVRVFFGSMTFRLDK